MSAGTGAPAVGAVVHDTKRDRVGVVMAIHAGRIFLRPKGGGCEWEAAGDDLCPVDPRAELRSRVRELNALSRWGVS